MAMKITLSAAMRARDVSRPQPGDLVQAEEADAASARAPRVPAGRALEAVNAEASSCI